MFEAFRGHLKNIAHIGAATINIAATKRLIARLDKPLNNAQVTEIEHSKDYSLIDNKLQIIRQAEPKLIQYIYILVPTDAPNNSRFLVDADVLQLTTQQAKGEKVSEEISHYGLEYDVSELRFIKQTFATKTLMVEDELVADPVYQCLRAIVR